MARTRPIRSPDTIDEKPLPLCLACGGSGVEPSGSECSACEGWGIVAQVGVTDEAPADEPADLEDVELES